MTSAFASDIKSDETVVFFPTTATRDAGGSTWTVPIHGWIFEPERDSAWRRQVIEELQEQFGVEADSEEGRRCADRASLFLADNEGRKKLSIRIAGRVHALPASGGNGHFAATLTLGADEVEAHAREGRLAFVALTRKGDTRVFSGSVFLAPATGVAVISDIDDTIKVSEVLDRRALLRHTFVLPFEAVEGMPAAYMAWAARGASFHYVSSSPWQLYPPLARFVTEKGYPAGTFHLKAFSLSGPTLLNLFKSPLATKPPRIRGILARHPGHTFVLVGDSGEQDPEVYGRIAREHPERIRHVFIRRVDGADNRAERFEAAFAGVPAARWTVFDDPSALRPDAVTAPR